jgi:WD repeat-containing protein 68
MPFSSHFHHQQQQDQPNLANGIYQAAHALGSIAAPTGNLRSATSGTTKAGTDVFLPQSQPQQAYSGQAQAQQIQAPPQAQQHPHINNYSEQFELTQRPHPTARMSDDLQLPPVAQSLGADYSQSPHQSAPPGAIYGAPLVSNSVPGSLQPGLATRPGPPQSAYTAPTVPQVPHISTNAQQYTLPTRSNTMHNASHSYSRSSPAGLEQKYIPFNNNPESQKYPQTPQQQPPKFYTPQTPTGASSNSPLALDQIRPRANSNMGGDDMSGATLFGDSMERAPTNSNYLSPWAVFAFDWCKYPVPHGNSAGKIAVGSYLEDPHNYVCIRESLLLDPADR